MKTVMILGAGIYQVPLIKQAKKMGLRVIVVSYKGNYPGIQLADIFLDINTTDCEAVLLAAQKYNIDAILTTGTDVCVPTLGYVADKLNLTGPSYDAACKSMNKVLMKQAFKEHGVKTAQHGVFNQREDGFKFAEKIGFPVMVKAPDSSGSRGISKVQSAEEFDQAWDLAAKISRVGSVIVEQYLEGIEFGAQAFICGDKVMEVLPHGDTVTPPPYCSPIGHSIPADLSEDILQKTRCLIDSAAKALDLKNCVANVDLMLVGDEPYILEIGGRMGATCLPENISIYSGQNVYEYLIRSALGESVSFEVRAKQPNACLLLRSGKSGIIEDIIIPDSVKNHPDLVEIQLDYCIGDSVNKYRIGPDRIGHIIVKGNSAKQAEDLAEKLNSEIVIKVKDAEE